MELLIVVIGVVYFIWLIKVMVSYVGENNKNNSKNDYDKNINSIEIEEKTEVIREEDFNHVEENNEVKGNNGNKVYNSFEEYRISRRREGKRVIPIYESVHKEENNAKEEKSSFIEEDEYDFKNKEYRIDDLSFEKERFQENVKVIDRLIRLGGRDLNNLYEERDFHAHTIEDIEMKRNIIYEINAAAKNLAFLEKARLNPYFGRLIVYNSEEEYYDIYIGEKSIFDTISKEYIVYDWRSPVCELYYINQVNNRINDLHYKTLLKRSIIIENGEFVSATDLYRYNSNVTRYDEFLNKILEDKKNETEVSNIISSIQDWQNRIIRLDINKNLLCQGVAGSGKTAIMLHRLSYLLFNYPNVDVNKYMILCPSKLFQDSLSEINKELGVDKILMCSLEDYYLRCIKNIFYRNVSLSKKSLRDKVNEDYFQYIFRNIFDIYNSELNKIKRCLSEIDKSYVYSEAHFGQDKVICEIRKYLYILTEKIEPMKRIMTNVYNYFDDNNHKSTEFEMAIDAVFCKNDSIDFEFSQYSLEDIYNKIMEVLKDKNNIKIVNYLFEIFDIYMKNISNSISDKMKSIIARILNSVEAKSFNVQKEYFQEFLLSKLSEISFKFKNIDVPQYVKCAEIIEQSSKLLEKKYFINILCSLDSSIDNILEKVNVSFSSVRLILYIQNALGFSQVNNFKYIYIDEAQMYDKFDLELVANIESNAKFNIFGDINQYMGENKRENWDYLKGIFDDLNVYQVNYNYRNTKELVEYCNENLGLKMVAIGPSGNSVKIFNHFDINDIYKYKKFVFITNDVRIYNDLMEKGISIYRIEEVKGLEFQNVVVIDNGMTRNEKYVAYTRSLNDLVIFNVVDDLN